MSTSSHPEQVKLTPESPESSYYDKSSTSLNQTCPPFDPEETLRVWFNRLAESAVKRRELGVMFRDLRVVGLGATTTYQPTVGSVLNPFAIFENLKRARHPPVRDILTGFSGVVRPGEMLLVLGNPGSGCTTFLKTLANHREEFHSVQGEVHYDSLSPQEVTSHYQGDLQYCPEDDIHFPTLTVEETIKFAAKTRTPHSRTDGDSREKYINAMTDVLTTVFGLHHARKTLVGDARIHGISGGEKKRVSIAETLASRSLFNCWDNSTRGLDSATALEFVRALRIATDVARLSTVVSIYQAAESLYAVFDKVCVIYEGRMVYFGPANQARQYFIDMGYEPANRQTTPDFLVAATDPNARIVRSGFEAKVPRTAEEFVCHFNRSVIAQLNNDDMKSYLRMFVNKPQRASAYMESAHAEHASTTNRRSPYIISIPMQTRAVMLRRLQILKGNFGAVAVQIVTFMVQATIMGTVFLRLKNSTAAFFSREGLLYFAILFSVMSSMSEIPALFGQRAIVLRHQKAAMYHPFIDSAALTLVDIPITFVTMICYSVIVYFVVGLQVTVAQFFIFFLVVLTITLVMKAWFRALAATCSHPAPAQSLAGVSLLAMALYSGYSIPKPSMIGALRWISYISPLRYGYESIVTNEFRTLNSSCSTLVPQGPGYENVSLANQVCTVVGSIPGQAFVDGTVYTQIALGYQWSHIWMNYGIMIAFGIAFLTWLFVVTELRSRMTGARDAILFKRGSDAGIVDGAFRDEEEKTGTSTTAARSRDTTETEKVLAEQPKMVDVFSWQHLNYTIPVPGGEKRRLLNDVSGFVVPGKLTALMGESGAGKTTLLNVLADRTSVGVVIGDRFVNGQPLPTDFHAQTGYCQQTDTHVRSATVHEAILFSATLRQPQSVSLAEKEAYTQKCLIMCGLEKYADAVVGTLGVEHRKRLTIAVELAAKPKLLLFLDEPTSGLDSQSAWAIVSFLRFLADNGQAILCTIHQPSAELFQSFDRLLLLRKGGETVYSGDLGVNATTLIDYFERNGSRKCLPGENPAEFMLDVIGAGASATSATDWHNDVWKVSPEAQATQQQIDNIHKDGRSRPPVETELHSEFSTSWIHQTMTLLHRNFQSTWRDPVYIMSKLALNVAAGLFNGSTFWKCKDTIQGTQNKLFAAFTSLIVLVPMAQQLQIPFLTLRAVYEIRERPSRMYSWTALITSQFLVEIPYNLLSGGLFFSCWYWTVGFHSDRAGFTYLMLAVMLPSYYTSLGQAVAAMCPGVEISALLLTFIFSVVIVFNGVLQPYRILGWWRWMYHVSPYTYLIESVVGQAIGNQEINCAPVEFVTINPPSGQSCSQYMNPYISFAGGYLMNPDATSSCQFCAFRTTDQFLALSFNIRYSHHWRNAGIFLGFTVLNIVALYASMYIFRIKTWDFSKRWSLWKKKKEPM